MKLTFLHMMSTCNTSTVPLLIKVFIRNYMVLVFWGWSLLDFSTMAPLNSCDRAPSYTTSYKKVCLELYPTFDILPDIFSSVWRCCLYLFWGWNFYPVCWLFQVAASFVWTGNKIWLARESGRNAARKSKSVSWTNALYCLGWG